MYVWMYVCMYVCMNVCMNVCMYECMYTYVYVVRMSHRIRPLHRDLQWSIVLPFLINSSLIPPLEWSVGLSLWGRHSSHLDPWRTGPGDEILNKLWSHNHTGCVWLIRVLGTFRKWGHQSIPAWKGALLGDSVLWIVLPLHTH
jgi:hypothetical protein